MTESIRRNKTIVFAGGGTGGHLLPGIAVAEQLVTLGEFQTIFVGSSRIVEQQIIENSGYQHLSLPSASTSDLKRAPFRFLWRNSRAFFQALRFLRTESPAVVIGLGGFASVPVILAASWLKIPIVLLEQNIIPGRANQFLCGRASLVCISFWETQFKGRPSGEQNGPPRIVLTGNPVRKQILEAGIQRESAEKSDETLILVLGGSQGATAVNDAVLCLLERSGDDLPKPLHVVHQTGEAGYESAKDGYGRLKKRGSKLRVTVQPFFDDLTEWYTRADLIISRAGATTLAEIACLGIPTILIPFPNSMRDHQLINARYYVERGAALLVEQAPEPEVTAELLTKAVLDLLNTEEQRSGMSQKVHELAFPHAARRVAEELSGLILG
ncbi:UDP-N-acetylglucosamine--N-acetylmuramyl-(pentapeptide) pyrophosphoryl-undecaprenol N-acetylglucosamine transferase MurG [Gimesia alba]|uniref:UDP-N-acetylglucosamine--N-acetylmuramyl-(pentapeptide) pyrophosphoryl-undecaprenol N-acetylglucosamine transferase n=1 Tax=Gimesia alba TaxID=2527973 RepID=A0A517REW5_9PLAN|nr:undecaprenyldiphospho-muramoylpentapeptide beta-N-acetylglucosaminyltransferase [Gimesia alba]QDT42416.1 UDP-N-acetylglucosamine--N-acetylmuramyl-(pentapeptide) pyrophosphoryl-undecaprenol N-acetylglucosamine transferase MurG [Gimesia alba]